MRKIVLFVLCALILASVASAETIIDGVTEIGDYEYERAEITNLVISDSIKRIGEGAFYYCKNLKSATLPEGLTEIGDYAFDHCLQLKEIRVPSSVRRIGESAFCYNQSLETLELSEGVVEIGAYAFSSCMSLKHLILPSTVKFIGEGAFMGMRNLEALYVPAGVRFTGTNMFVDCPKLKIYFTPPTNVESYIRIYKIPFEIVDYPPEFETEAPVTVAEIVKIKLDGEETDALSVDCEPFLGTRYFPTIDSVKGVVGTGKLSKTAKSVLDTMSKSLFINSETEMEPQTGTVSAVWGEFYVNKYGNRATTEFDGIHEGIDLCCHTGNMVRSLTDGTVKLRYGNTYGTIVIEKDGYYITYMHCAESYVENGEKVSKGDIIGYQGSVGTKGAHVHIEVSKSYSGGYYTSRNNTLESYASMGNEDIYTILNRLISASPDASVAKDTSNKRSVVIDTAYSWLEETWTLPCDIKLYNGSVVKKGTTVRGLPYTLCHYGYNPPNDPDRYVGTAATSYTQYKQCSNSFTNINYISAAGTTNMNAQGHAIGKYTPKHGADCIQLVYIAWETADPNTTYRDDWYESSATIIKGIAWSDALPGDAVYETGPKYDHIRLITSIDNNGTPDDVTDDRFTCVEQTTSELGKTLTYLGGSYTMIGTREAMFDYATLVNDGYVVWRNTCLDN